jgi:hypothetical protein
VKFKNPFKKVTLLILALVMMSFALNYASAHKASAVDYSFKVHNGARCYIDELLVSENGKSWGNFDLGKGVAPGQTMTLVWDKSTDNSKCEWWIKAKFADGAESKAAKFDFCEKDLILDF